MSWTHMSSSRLSIYSVLPNSPLVRTTKRRHTFADTILADESSAGKMKDEGDVVREGGGDEQHREGPVHTAGKSSSQPARLQPASSCSATAEKHSRHILNSHTYSDRSVRPALLCDQTAGTSIRPPCGLHLLSQKQSTRTAFSQPCGGRGVGGDHPAVVLRGHSLEPHDFTCQCLERSQIPSGASRGPHDAIQSAKSDAKLPSKGRHALLEAVRKRLRYNSQPHHLPANWEDAGQATESAVLQLKEGACAARHGTKPAQFSPPDIVAAFPKVRATGNPWPAEDHRPEFGRNYDMGGGSVLQEPGYSPATRLRLPIKSSLNRESPHRPGVDSSLHGRRRNSGNENCMPLPLVRRELTPSRAGDDGRTDDRFRALITTCVNGIGSVDSARREETIDFFFEECVSMCQCPILLPCPVVNLPLVDPTIRKEIRNVTAFALSDPPLRKSVTAGAFKLCLALLKAPPIWHNAEATSTWFARPALLELLVAFVDESQCNKCIGNLAVLIAATSAFAEAEKWKPGTTEVDNVLMLLKAVAYSVENLHPQCYTDTTVEDLASQAFEALETQLDVKRLNSYARVPVCMRQIFAIQVAAEQLKRQVTKTLLEGKSDERQQNRKALRTVGGGWRIDLPFSLRLCTEKTPTAD